MHNNMIAVNRHQIRDQCNGTNFYREIPRSILLYALTVCPLLRASVFFNHLLKFKKIPIAL